MLLEQTSPYIKGDRRKIKSHGLKYTGLYHTTPHNSTRVAFHTRPMKMQSDKPQNPISDHVTMTDCVNNGSRVSARFVPTCDIPMYT